MYVNGVATARVNETEYTDGWFRTFRKAEIPPFNADERKLLTDYVECGKLEEIIIYLDRFRDIKGELAEFVLREFIRKNL